MLALNENDSCMSAVGSPLEQDLGIRKFGCFPHGEVGTLSLVAFALTIEERIEFHIGQKVEALLNLLSCTYWTQNRRFPSPTVQPKEFGRGLRLEGEGTVHSLLCARRRRRAAPPEFGARFRWLTAAPLRVSDLLHSVAICARS